MTVTVKQRNDSTKGEMMENNWTDQMWKDHSGSLQLRSYSQSLGRPFLFVVKTLHVSKYLLQSQQIEYSRDKRLLSRLIVKILAV